MPTNIVCMGHVVRDALRAGALGFSTSRSCNHKTRDGCPISSLDRADDELLGIARGVHEAGRGVIEIAGGLRRPRGRRGVRAVPRAGADVGPHGVAADDTATTTAVGDCHLRILELMAAAERDGLSMRAQVPIRSVGVMIGLDNRLNPFGTCASFVEVAELPPASVPLRPCAIPPAAGARPHRARGTSRHPVRRLLSITFPLREPLDYEPAASESVVAQAAVRGVSAAEHAVPPVGRRRLDARGSTAPPTPTCVATSSSCAGAAVTAHGAGSAMAARTAR